VRVCLAENVLRFAGDSPQDAPHLALAVRARKAPLDQESGPFRVLRREACVAGGPTKVGMPPLEIGRS
jgi:hypothetical protein